MLIIKSPLEVLDMAEELLYEGKAKKIFSTDDPNVLLVQYKDSLTAFNAKKRDEKAGKGHLNNVISSWIFTWLAKKGVESHFIKQVDETHQLIRKVEIIPLETIVRNVTTGSLCRRLGVEEGKKLSRPIIEFSYKSDALDDPLINDDHAIVLGWATEEEVATIKSIAPKVNKLLTELFASVGVLLVDFKLEFGRDEKGRVLLADEISPDTCRFWDSKTHDHLDKDRFRKDLGDVLGAYEEIWRRLSARGMDA